MSRQHFLLRRIAGAGKMAQWVQVLVAKPSDQVSIPRTHMMKEENWLRQVIL